MKQMLLKIVKGLLIISLLLLLILVVFGLVLLIEWPWWVGFFLLIGLIGLVLGFLLLKKFLKRRREQKFVHMIVEQDESARSKLAPKEQDAAKELQVRWKEAIDALRKSHLRKHGNPLYVLPWYMVIGESGSGKTTAIESARLSSPFAEVSRTSGISGTRNCDWWFFEQAILIDTAGRWAIPVDEGRDKDEWQKFLNLLSKFRKKEPLNGLVVTVAADRLAQNSPEALKKDGVSIRRRIDELMRVLGAKFPVYVMVTKCDLIQGATQFCDSLPENALNQAMGMLNHDLSTDIKKFMGKAFRHVGDRLRELRLILLNEKNKSTNASDSLLFPEEFEKLTTPLSAFIEGAFQENPYQETPLLRGLFYSSGRQEGTPFSHFLNALGLIQGRDVLAGTNKGLFLHDLFAKILPSDRRLFRPTQNMDQWRKLTRNMGLTAWIAIMIAACGLLSYSFVKNLNALSDVRLEFDKETILEGNLFNDISTLDRHRSALLKVEKENRKWWIPRLGLHESIEVESKLKQKFVKLYHRAYLTEFDQSMVRRISHFNANTPNKEFGAHVAHLARRINLLKARINDDDTGKLSVLPQPSYDSLLNTRSDFVPMIKDQIEEQYLYAVTWRQNKGALNNEIINLQKMLEELLSIHGISINWMVDLVNSDPNLKSIGMQDYWGGTPSADMTKVPPAYTQAGREKVQAVIGEIKSAVTKPMLITRHEANFEKWYNQKYLASWTEFVRTFDKGESLLKGREQWQSVAKQLNTPQGPYYALIDTITKEFETLGETHVLPPWITLAQDWQDVRVESKAADVVDPSKSSIVRKGARRIRSGMRRVERATGTQYRVRKPMKPEAQMKAATSYAKYKSGLDACISATISRSEAFKMASDLYSQDQVKGESPILSAQRALKEVKLAMGEPNNNSEKLFWNLLNGNLRFMQQYVNREAACVLQEKWKDDVLLNAEDISAEQDMGQLMMGSSGFAKKYLEGPAKPFIERSYGKGYHSKKVHGLEIPFEKTFLNYIQKGAQASKPRQSSYKITITTLPTDTNSNATKRPHSTLLEMECAGQPVRLENFHYQARKTFTWKPSECGDVSFKINIGNLVLTKTYTGYSAFAKFLDDFKSGSRTFYRSEFTREDENQLRRYKIKYIKPKYRFSGHREALKMLYSAIGPPPRKIVTCWD